ncbi:MAG: hypothetical protein JWN99_2111 [Ilumatobacteraceae bacterium]|nr:hypothetical protein [Ilumatobacteraceae bacterium]
MTTLLEYATTQFPNHITEQTGGDTELTDHTAVAHVVGSANGIELARRIRQALPTADVGAVMVRPTDPTVVPNGGEDPNGVVDLPARRVATAGAFGGVGLGIAAGIVVGLVTSSAVIGVIVGVFAAIIGSVIAGMIGGGGRYAGDHAWDQPHAPDRTVAVVAAFTENERDAVAAARIMDALDPYEVRIVAADGAWHTPNT